MGVNGDGKKIRHAIEGLSLADILSIARQRRHARGETGPVKFVIDANLLGCKWGTNAIMKINSLASIFADEGAEVELIGDRRDFRHHSKRESTKRRANCEKALLDAIEARIEIMTLKHHIQNPPEGYDVQGNKRRLVELGKKKKRRENQSEKRLNPDFLTQLDQSIAQLNGTRAGPMLVAANESCFQADAVIASRVITGDADMIISSDSDFVLLAGEHALAITGFNIKNIRNKSRQNATLENITLTSGFLDTLKSAGSIICDDTWEERYGGRRVMFWDNMIVVPSPSDPDLNRLTNSSYYGGNVGKGGVFLQLCGWLGTHHLWTGAVSDTHYQTESGILDIQKMFAEHDLVNGNIVPFTNITDKGYRCVAAAWRN